MKRLVLLATTLLICVNLISCSAFTALSYSISGDIIDPVDGFSFGDDKGTLVFDGNNYILIEEVGGCFEFDFTEDDVLLGQTSNFPFFPNFSYYANAGENAEYIAGGSASNNVATFVYLREDLYESPLLYVLQDTDHEFDFSSAFIETNDVSHKTHIEGKRNYGTDIHFYVKDIPRLAVSMRITKIDEKWYFVETDEAYELSDSFLGALEENDLLPK